MLKKILFMLPVAILLRGCIDEVAFSNEEAL
jgi:hypothetical protein